MNCIKEQAPKLVKFMKIEQEKAIDDFVSGSLSKKEYQQGRKVIDLLIHIGEQIQEFDEYHIYMAVLLHNVLTLTGRGPEACKLGASMLKDVSQYIKETEADDLAKDILQMLHLLGGEDMGHA